MFLLMKGYLSIHFRSQMQYKTSFFLTVLGQFLSTFTVFLGVFYMLERFNTVQGFTFSEVLLCFSTVLLSFSLAECFARGFDSFSRMISNGEFDRVLARPQPIILQVLGSKVDFTRMGRVIQAIAVMAYAIPTCGVSWTPSRLAVLLLMVLGGVLLFTALFIIYASFCFFTIEGLEFMNIFTDGGREFGRYPLSVYGKRVLQFFTCIVPLALVQYYPLLFLLGRAKSPLWAVAPIGSLLFFIPALTFWRFGVRHYKSTGS